ncbi:hypothetical protein [Celeribacter halophilus]
MVAMSGFENEVTRTYQLLGGKRTINAPIDTALMPDQCLKVSPFPHFYTW